MNQYPAYATLDRWEQISGMKRSKTYQALGAGHIRAIKLDGRLLIDVEYSLGFLRSLPLAQIRPPSRHRAAKQEVVATA